MRLNDALIANERYRGEPSTDEEGKTTWPVYVLWDDEVPGMGLRIFPSVRGRPSRKDFIVTWKTGLKSRTMAIGTYGVDCTLRQARRTAREALDLARRGQDPIEARHRALGIGTNEDLASRFLFEHSAAKKKPVPEAEPAPAGEAPDPTASNSATSPEAAAPAVAPEAATPEATAPRAEPPVVAAGVGDQVVESEPRLEAPPETPPEPSDEAAAPPHVEPAGAAPAPEPARQFAARPIGARPAAARPSSASPPPAAPAPPAPAIPPVAAAPVAAPHAEATEPRPDHAPPGRRGPTKVRLLPIPETLHREIERRAREGGLTTAAYLQTLVDLEAAVSSVRRGVGAPAPQQRDEPTNRPLKDILEQVEANQDVDIAALMADSFDSEPSRRGGGD